MEAVDDEKPGLDARDFGSLLHDVLETMGRDEELWRCADADKLGEALAAEAERRMHRQYGKALSLPLLLALDAARNRLAAAARVQVALAQEGWDIVQTEKKYEMALGGLTLRGKIDRVDRHRASGRIRILDYKSSDAEVRPGVGQWAAAGFPGP